ncbi:MAG: type II toxin-antitoxin system HicA family toxin [Acidobacteria bacterium]|nr:type II toxin-antitoxin system HicA family toxin [Acidobacteriota bacterium]
MRIPRGVNARDFIRALLDDGFCDARTEGSHHRFKHPDGRAVTVAYHKLSDTFTMNTLQRMFRDTRSTEDALRRHQLID